MTTPERIYIAGFMGTGKSTVGPRVARRLGYDSMDLDKAIESDLGMSIPAIFDILGEEAFRNAEQQLLAQTAGRNKIVVSLGGGTVLRPANMKFCREHGRVLALDAPVDVLVQRLARSPNPRPLIQDDSGNRLRGDALRSRIESMLRQRRPAYEAAHHVVNVGGNSLDSIVGHILEILEHGEAY